MADNVEERLEEIEARIEAHFEALSIVIVSLGSRDPALTRDIIGLLETFEGDARQRNEHSAWISELRDLAVTCRTKRRPPRQ